MLGSLVSTMVGGVASYVVGGLDTVYEEQMQERVFAEEEDWRSRRRRYYL